MQILDQKIGPETEVKVEFAGGKLAVTTTYVGDNGGATVSAYVSEDAVLAALEAKFTNAAIKAAIELVRNELKSVA